MFVYSMFTLNMPLLLSFVCSVGVHMYSTERRNYEANVLHLNWQDKIVTFAAFFDLTDLNDKHFPSFKSGKNSN